MPVTLAQERTRFPVHDQDTHARVPLASTESGMEPFAGPVQAARLPHNRGLWLTHSNFLMFITGAPYFLLETQVYPTQHYSGLFACNGHELKLGESLPEPRVRYGIALNFPEVDHFPCM